MHDTTSVVEWTLIAVTAISGVPLLLNAVDTAIYIFCQHSDCAAIIAAQAALH